MKKNTISLNGIRNRYCRGGGLKNIGMKSEWKRERMIDRKNEREKEWKRKNEREKEWKRKNDREKEW